MKPTTSRKNDDRVERAALAEPVDDDVGDVLDDAAGGAEVGGHLHREEQDADREDDRDDAGLVHAQRQERGATLVHAPAADAAGVLDGDAALALLDVDDDRDGRDGQRAPKAMPAARSGEVRNVLTAPGRPATMPAKMMKLMPLPMPRSVMSSPIHITRMVPAVSVMIWVSVVKLVEVEVAGPRRAGRDDSSAR